MKSETARGAHPHGWQREVAFKVVNLAVLFGSAMRRYLAALLFSCTFLPLCSPPAWAREASDPWVEAQSSHFIVLTDTNEKQARRIASQFERMRSVFRTIFPAGTADPPSPIVVLALKDRKDFQTVEPPAYLAKGQLDLAGLFMRAPDKNYILLRLDAQGEHPYATIYHEYTHFMLSKAEEWLPLWLNEGLAEFYQNTNIEDKDVRLGQPSPDDILFLRQNRLLPLTVLFKVDQTSPYYHEEQKGSVFYAESWALTHYIEINDRQNKTEHLQDYAKLLVQHVDPLIAAQKVFGDLNQLQRSLEQYVSQGTFSYFKMNTPVTLDETSIQIRAVPTPEANAVRADVLVYNERPKDAQALLDTTLRDDPTSALAHESMGYLKFREGDIAAARKWYGEAVKLDSRSFLAHYYYASMLMQSGEFGKEEEIDSSLRTSMKLNPAFAPSYDALAMFYGMRHEKLSEAHILNVKAVMLDPDNLNFRLNTANVLEEEQQYPGAISVLKAAMRVAKTPEQIAEVQARISQAETAKSAQENAGSYGIGQPGMTITAINGKPVENTAVQQQVVSVDTKPKYPTEAPTGPRHSVKGILRDVHCSYPNVITLSVDQAGKRVSLYRNDLAQINFTAANFTPKNDTNACHEIEGMNARVEYAEVSDKSVGGQILSIELSK